MRSPSQPSRRRKGRGARGLAEPAFGEDGRRRRASIRRRRRRTLTIRRERGQAAFELGAVGARERRTEIDGRAVDAVDLPELRERSRVARGTVRQLADLGRSRVGRGRNRNHGERGGGHDRRGQSHSSASRWLRGFHPGGGGQYGGCSSSSTSTSSRRGAWSLKRANGEASSPGSTPICSARSCRSNASLRTRRSK